MRQIPLLALLISCFIQHLVAQEQRPPLIDEYYQLSIPFPEKATQFEDTLLLGTDTLNGRSWEMATRDTSNKNFFYWAETAFYPPAYVHSDSSLAFIEALFDDAAFEFFSDTNFVHQFSTLDFLSGYPGKTYKFSFQPNGNLIELRVYLVENQFMQFEIYTESGHWHNRRIEEFFDGIALVNRTDNEEDYGLGELEPRSFSIEFPEGERELQNLILDSGYGQLRAAIEVLERKNAVGRNLVFIAGETIYPDDFLLTKAIETAFFDEAIAGAVRAVDGELLSTGLRPYQGFPGIEVLVSIYEGQAFFNYRLIQVNRRLYMLGVMSHRQSLDGEAIAFFNSFQLLE